MIGKPAALLAVLTMALVAFPSVRPAVCDAVHADLRAMEHMAGHDGHDDGASLSSVPDLIGCHGMMQCGIADGAPTMSAATSVVTAHVGAVALPYAPHPRFANTAPVPPPPRR